MKMFSATVWKIFHILVMELALLSDSVLSSCWPIEKSTKRGPLTHPLRDPKWKKIRQGRVSECFLGWIECWVFCFEWSIFSLWSDVLIADSLFVKITWLKSTECSTPSSSAPNQTSHKWGFNFDRIFASNFDWTFPSHFDPIFVSNFDPIFSRSMKRHSTRTNLLNQNQII